LQQDRCQGEIKDGLVALPRALSSFFQNPETPGIKAVFICPGHGEEPMQERIEIVVDGSGDGHSVALFPGEEVFFSYERGASNNEAEFNAVILALEHLPDHAYARIRTDSQVVVWHLSEYQKSRHPTFLRKKIAIKDLIVTKNIRLDIQWIPRKQNNADRFLKQYIASLCGAGGTEPLYRRVRRLENENSQLRSRLKRAMRMLERRNAFSRDPIPLEMLQ